MAPTRPLTGAVKRKLAAVIDGTSEEYSSSPEESEQEEERLRSSKPRSTKKRKGKKVVKKKAKTTRARGKDTAESDTSESGASAKLPDRVVGPAEKLNKAIPGWVADVAQYRNRSWAACFSEESEKGYIHRLVPREVIYDEFWSVEDEADLDRLWEQGDWDMSQYNPGKYRTMWTWSLLFMKCTPWEVLGMANGFSYERTKAGRPSEKSGHIWSAPFLDKMCVLFPHPIWASELPHGRPRKLIMALQYAVILRTDGRYWHINKGGDDAGTFLGYFNTLIRESEESIPIRDLRVRAARECVAVGIEPGEMSLLFRAMEKVVAAPKESLRAEQDEPKSFNLTLKDLRNLEQALDQQKDMLTGAQLHLPAEFIATSVTEPGKRGRSVTYTELEKWHELAVLDQLRRCRRSERLEARDEMDNFVGSDPPAVGSDQNVELGHSRSSRGDVMEVDDAFVIEESEDDMSLDAGPASSPSSAFLMPTGLRHPTPPPNAAAAVSARQKRLMVEEPSQLDPVDSFKPNQESEGVEQDDEQEQNEEDGDGSWPVNTDDEEELQINVVFFPSLYTTRQGR